MGLSPATRRFGKQVAVCMDSLRFRDKGSALGYSYRFPLNPTAIENKLITVAALNQIWQAWTFFCREFWIEYELRFGDRNGTVCRPENLLSNFLSGNSGYGNRRRNNNGFLEYYNEPTWGDVDKLEKALQLAAQTEEVVSFRSRVYLAHSDIKDIQNVRNASIHSSWGSMRYLQAEVSPRYSIRSNNHLSLSLPCSLVYSIQICSQAIAIEAWTKSLMQCVISQE